MEKPLLSCRARDEISWQVWCHYFMLQGLFVAMAITKSRAKDLGLHRASLQHWDFRHMCTSHIVNLIGGITCSFGRDCLSNLVSNQVPLQLLQIGQYTSALQTHGQKTKIHHLPATLKVVCDVDVFAQE